MSQNILTLKNSLVQVVHEEDNEESKVDKIVGVKYVETPRSQIVIALNTKKEKIDEEFSEESSVPDENSEEEKLDSESDDEDNILCRRCIKFRL